MSDFNRLFNQRYLPSDGPASARGSLAKDFQFSQSSLQDYRDCRRRFQLRYIYEVAWPAAESEPVMENEIFIQRGALFHRLAQQFFVGVPADRLSVSIHEEELHIWWQNFLNFCVNPNGWIASALSERHRTGDHRLLQPEISLSAPIGNYRLAAKFDLIVSAGQGGFKIFDWKTSNHHPQRKWLIERMQTRVYPYLLVQAGSALNHGAPIDPAGVEMIYWYAAFPDEPLHFPYSAAQFERDHHFLQGLVEEIAALPPDQYRRVSEEDRCAYCIYRSLCERGEQAGRLSEQIDDRDPDDVQIDFDQIAEIEF